jgi:hypothetical protein
LFFHFYDFIIISPNIFFLQKENKNYSYLAAILAGTGLLMLPIAAVSGFISIIDALFTATSAVCVTGLIVVDTGKFFTLFGQGVIIVLIQLGGLGIMIRVDRNGVAALLRITTAEGMSF